MRDGLDGQVAIQQVEFGAFDAMVAVPDHGGHAVLREKRRRKGAAPHVGVRRNLTQRDRVRMIGKEQPRRFKAGIRGRAPFRGITFSQDDGQQIEHGALETKFFRCGGGGKMPPDSTERRYVGRRQARVNHNDAAGRKFRVVLSGGSRMDGIQEIVGQLFRVRPDPGIEVDIEHVNVVGMGQFDAMCNVRRNQYQAARSDPVCVDAGASSCSLIDIEKGVVVYLSGRHVQRFFAFKIMNQAKIGHRSEKERVHVVSVGESPGDGKPKRGRSCNQIA